MFSSFPPNHRNRRMFIYATRRWSYTTQQHYDDPVRLSTNLIAIRLIAHLPSWLPKDNIVNLWIQFLLSTLIKSFLISLPIGILLLLFTPCYHTYVYNILLRVTKKAAISYALFLDIHAWSSRRLTHLTKLLIKLGFELFVLVTAACPWLRGRQSQFNEVILKWFWNVA